MKKKIGIFSIVIITATMLFNMDMTNKFVNNSKVDLGSLMLIQNANAEWPNKSDCDTDPNDSCWSQETGHKYTDCDPSSFWDTCGD